MFEKNLNKLRAKMKENNIDLAIITDDDKTKFAKSWFYATLNGGLGAVLTMIMVYLNYSNSNEYFQLLKKTATKLNLKELSMGMSDDYEQAISYGSTFLRLGTVIFGKRDI